MRNSKKTWISMISIALVCVMVGTGIGYMNSSRASAESTVVLTSPFTEAVSKVKDSVVGVSNYQTVRYSNRGSYGDWGNFFGWGNNWGNGYGYGNDRGNDYTEQEVLYGTGSGVVIEKGYVLTNYHVVEGASALKVTTADQEYPAELVSSDENLDVAVIYAPNLNIEPVTLGDSDTLQVGDWAICIGNPLSSTFTNTVTAGIISGLDRSIKSSSTDRYGRRETITNTMIQTDAAINSGNSGGGMFNTAGLLMGIPTMKYSGSAFSGASIESISLCIPINAAKPLIQEALSVTVDTSDLESSASASANTLEGKPRMGITINSINVNSSAVQQGLIPRGVYVVEVDEGSPAEIGGMQAGDIIVDVDGNVITSISQLQGILADKDAGDSVQVKVYRVPGGLDNNTQDIPEGEYIDLTVTLEIVDPVKQ